MRAAQSKWADWSYRGDRRKVDAGRRNRRALLHCRRCVRNAGGGWVGPGNRSGRRIREAPRERLPRDRKQPAPRFRVCSRVGAGSGLTHSLTVATWVEDLVANELERAKHDDNAGEAEHERPLAILAKKALARASAPERRGGAL